MPGASGRGLIRPHAVERRVRSGLRWPPAEHRPGAAARTVPSRQATMVDSTPDPRRAAIEDRVDPAVEVGQDVLGVGRADPARPIGRGCGDRSADRARSRCARGWDGTRRPTLSRPARARSQIVQPGAAGTTRVSGPGQNAAASSSAASSNKPCRGAASTNRDMRDQRVEARAVLGGVDAGDGLGAGRIGAEAVDGLGREGHQAATARSAAARARPVASAASRSVSDH